MTPQEKAKQLVEKYRIMIKFDSVYNLQWNDPRPDEDSVSHKMAIKDAKMYALATANEVIEQEKNWINATNKGSSTFWKHVKKEINKL